MRTYIMKELKGGEYVVDVLKNPMLDIADTFKRTTNLLI